MKHIALIGVIFLGYGFSVLRAGSVVTLADGSEATGKLTLNPDGISVETSSSPTEIKFSDILEADFGETPFQLDCFSGSGAGGNQLPAAWKAQDIGAVDSPGSAINASGTWTLSGGGVTPKLKMYRASAADALFFVGQPWMGDGQWTARVKEIDATNPETAAGLMLRDTLDADSVMVSLTAMTLGNGEFACRANAGKRLLRTPISMNLPIWLRLTRLGTGVFAAISSDGNEWDLIGQGDFKPLATPWIGLFADSHKDKQLGQAVIDQISLTPAPSLAQVLPPGVLLQSGSFLAGAFDHLGFDPANPDAEGSFRRNGELAAVPPSKIAAVIMLPTARSQLAEMGSQVGLLMKNGDVMNGDFNSINGNGAIISSVLLGITTYNRSEIRACLLHPLQAQPASYEIRLRDGSMIKANALSIDKSKVVIEEVSGVKVVVSPDEMAQFRAGPSEVQSLAELNWKATSPPVAPATHAESGPSPPVSCWEGPNQEQIMQAPVGTTLNFPLKDKFHALGMRIALSPDSPPNSQVSLRVLADGREIARTPPFKAGDQPRFIEVTIQDPKTVTLQVDSIFAGAKVLFIDPVALRDNQP